MDTDTFTVSSKMVGVDLNGPKMKFEISFAGCCTSEEYTELVDELYHRLFKGGKRSHER